MRLTNLVTFTVSFGAAAPSLAIPVTTKSSPILNARSQYCANAPLTVAGSTFDRRSFAPDRPSFESPLYNRDTPSVLWCAPNSQTYVVIRMTSVIAGEAVPFLLRDAIDYSTYFIDSFGDGPISPGGWYNAEGMNNLWLHTWNANNHQTTWGVLKAACSALLDYMTANNDYGSATFEIYDGANQVGEGTIGQ